MRLVGGQELAFDYRGALLTSLVGRSRCVGPRAIGKLVREEGGSDSEVAVQEWSLDGLGCSEEAIYKALVENQG